MSSGWQDTSTTERDISKHLSFANPCWTVCCCTGSCRFPMGWVPCNPMPAHPLVAGRVRCRGRLQLQAGGRPLILRSIFTVRDTRVSETLGFCTPLTAEFRLGPTGCETTKRHITKLHSEVMQLALSHRDPCVTATRPRKKVKHTHAKCKQPQSIKPVLRRDPRLTADARRWTVSLDGRG
jgi:hypothetical protein